MHGVPKGTCAPDLKKLLGLRWELVSPLPHKAHGVGDRNPT